jgi:hypothetical protein
MILSNEGYLADGSKERCVFMLYGLGGARKTQLALKFVELQCTRTSKFMLVSWLDSSLMIRDIDTTIEADLKSIALAKHVGDNPSDALTWLAGLTEE